MPVTNYKCGINVIFGGTEGVSHAVEHPYFDKVVFDLGQVVYVQKDTLISFSHNATNTASLSGRSKTEIGTTNPTGSGQVRYVFDELWRVKQWSHPTDPVHTAYTAPFKLEDLEYAPGIPVLGTVGGRAGYASTSPNWWNYGLVDECGEEYHVLRYADDDSGLGDGSGDSLASDGKYLILVVDPKTPCLTVAAGTGGQFYTTPAFTYHVPKIHEQITYFQGDCTFTLRDITGNNVFYRINGGSFISAGASFVVLDQDDFTSGNNTLEYYYAGNVAYTKTRTVVKNPAFPSAAETHGDLIWGEDNWARMLVRKNRAPYTGYVFPTSTVNSEWDGLKRTGRKMGAAYEWPHHNPGGSLIALQGRIAGFDEVPSGSTLSWAASAKERLLETTLNNAPVGVEVPTQAASSLPCQDIWYRGYYDAGPVFDAAVTYDLVAGYARSNQVSGGLTPVEDYFIRDRLAGWVHLALLNLSGGLWPIPRQTAAQMIAVVMPRYSSHYFGSCGLEGVTTVFPWAPFQTYNEPWVNYLIAETSTIRGFPLGVGGAFLVSGTVEDGGLCRVDAPRWGNKLDYVSPMLQSLCYYGNIKARYADLETGCEGFLAVMDSLSAGTLTASQGTPGSVIAGVTTTRSNLFLLINSEFPAVAENSAAWAQALPSNDPNSIETAIYDDRSLGSIAGLFFYDDNYYGGTVSAKPEPDILPGFYEDAPISVSLTCSTAGASIYYTTDGSTPDDESTVFSTPISITSGTTTIKAMAKTSGGGESPLMAAQYTICEVGIPAPPRNQQCTPL